MAKYKIGDRLFYINRYKEFMPCVVTQIHMHSVQVFNPIYEVEVYHKDGDSTSNCVKEEELYKAELVNALYG